MWRLIGRTTVGTPSPRLLQRSPVGHVVAHPVQRSSLRRRSARALRLVPTAIPAGYDGSRVIDAPRCRRVGTTPAGVHRPARCAAKWAVLGRPNR